MTLLHVLQLSVTRTAFFLPVNLAPSSYLPLSGRCLLQVGGLTSSVADVPLNLGLLDIIERLVLLCGTGKVQVKDVFFFLIHRNVCEDICIGSCCK